MLIFQLKIFTETKSNKREQLPISSFAMHTIWSSSWYLILSKIKDPEEYLHRVGRTARGAEAKGRALLILLKNELGILRLLVKYKVN